MHTRLGLVSLWFAQAEMADLADAPALCHCSMPWLPEAVVQPVEGDSLVVELTVLVWLLPRSRAWDKDLGAGGLF